MTAKVNGFKNIALAELQQETYFETKENILKLVENSIAQIIEGLTKQVDEAEVEAALPSEIITIQSDDLLNATEKMNRHFLSEGWSDGFPLVPPTPKAVEQMLTGTRLGRDEVIAVLDPGQGIGTVEKVAINAVMAGCRPEHMPLLIATVRCITQPSVDLHTYVMSTGSQSPLILINGPVAKKLNISSKGAALDPGSCNYANIVIGRALSLILMNIAQGYPSVLSMSTVGNPLNYSCCVAENEEDSPWEPYHVEKGYDKDTSTVTVMFVSGMCIFRVPSNTAEGVAEGLTLIASRVTNNIGRWLLRRGEWDKNDPESQGKTGRAQNLFLLNPNNARFLAREGWDKASIKQYLYEHAKLPLKVLMFDKSAKNIVKEYPELALTLKDNPELLLPIVAGPETFHIAVLGGSGQSSIFFEGSRSVGTWPIEE